MFKAKIGVVGLLLLGLLGGGLHIHHGEEDLSHETCIRCDYQDLRLLDRIDAANGVTDFIEVGEIVYLDNPRLDQKTKAPLNKSPPVPS